MNIFISWSGERSHRVAKLLKTWIKGVIQAAKPWISSTDINGGTIWFTEIIKQLDATTQGIICLTNENKEKPWILFEAGALANSGIESSRVYTLLVDVEQKDIQPPLAQFNLTKPDEDGMLKLMTDINSTLPDDVRLEKEVLEKGFKVYWPEFKADFDKALANTEAASSANASPSRTDKEILSEILDTVRGLDKRVRAIEERQPYSAPMSIQEFVDLANGTTDNQSQVFHRPSKTPMSVYIRRMVRTGASIEAMLEKAKAEFPSFSKKDLSDIIRAITAEETAN